MNPSRDAMFEYGMLAGLTGYAAAAVCFLICALLGGRPAFSTPAEL
jgi:hypothetical protein